MAETDLVLTWNDVLYMQLLLQHFDTMKAVNKAGEEPTLALSVGPDAVERIRRQLSVGHLRGPADAPKDASTFLRI